ncbi:MAG: hypothetical protein FJ077_14295 [Cyanobacteria bacterium K_DeepCast_35m_m2_023]|nr:hypothetical protein [Cyanobacteria bacterium K_DeepCast_35m_m2_023]
MTVQRSTGTEDPYEAAKRSVSLFQQWQGGSRALLDQQHEQTKNSLTSYWEKYFQAESRTRETQRNFKRWSREESLKWEADEYGIRHQPWAIRSVDLITSQDFKDYFSLLERRARGSNGSNGSGMKGQQKTLINKLLVLAEDDFPGHAFPRFPAISKQTKQVQHLTQKQWDQLLAAVVDLSFDSARQLLDPDEYLDLEWSKNNRLNQRNWVDLYDALLLEWFFYLRAEDMYRLRSEWFKDQGNRTVVCNLETIKKDRPIHQTTHYRNDAYRFWERLKRRKPSGYLVLPQIERPSGNPADSHVLKTLNFLLKHVMEQTFGNEFPSAGRKWTTIRHTAFRLTLEEDPSLAIPPKINSFADNGHTSPDQLRNTYLRYIDAERTARESRQTIGEGKWTMVKRAGET